jgi:hypothetical protein
MCFSVNNTARSRFFFESLLFIMCIASMISFSFLPVVKLPSYFDSVAVATQSYIR